MTDDMRIRVGTEEFVLRADADGLQVGRQVAGDVAWLDTVELLCSPPRPGRHWNAGTRPTTRC